MSQYNNGWPTCKPPIPENKEQESSEDDFIHGQILDLNTRFLYNIFQIIVLVFTVFSMYYLELFLGFSW